MPEEDDAYDPPCFWLKFQRAEEHLAAFKAAESAFFDEKKPVVIAERYEPDGSKLFVIERAALPPYALGLIAGDFLQNLRTSLDHLAWDLVQGHGEGTPDEGTSFPITRKPESFASVKGSALRWMDESVVAEIEKRQPYHVPRPEATDLWKLHDLARIDRHRYLHIVSAASLAMMPSRSHTVRNIEEASMGTGTLYEGLVLKRLAPEDADVGIEVFLSVGLRDYGPGTELYSMARLFDRILHTTRGILTFFDETFLGGSG